MGDEFWKKGGEYPGSWIMGDMRRENQSKVELYVVWDWISYEVKGVFSSPARAQEYIQANANYEFEEDGNLDMGVFILDALHD